MLRAIILATLVLTAGQSGSAVATQGLYDTLPQADRDQFRTSLEKRVSLEVEGKWSDLYELFDSVIPSSGYGEKESRITREQFINEMSRSDRLVRFSPSRITYIPPMDYWHITGCAEFSKPINKDHFFVSGVNARRTTEGWRFSHVAIELYEDPPSMRSYEISH
jgi:hypothetical protein